MPAPKITLNQIDNSAQAALESPSGRAAGVIGSAEMGQAFVPLTFANKVQFEKEFGTATADNHAPIALVEWLRSQTAGTYLRVLGAGDCKAAAGDGTVSGAGFVVGSRQVNKSTGQFADNEFATSTGILGRTHFLGCYMSESAGSKIFSSAGMQTSTTAVPVLRGVLLAASGVQIALSSSAASSTTASSAATTATAMAAGWLTGSVNLQNGSQEFVIFLNGHTNSSDYPSVITASFNPSNGSYFANVLNTNPFQLEKYGYVLYSHYDVSDALAIPTGSGISTQALVRRTSVSLPIEEIAFCLTGSQSRAVGTSVYPDYESFESRFSHPATTWFISEDLGGTRKNLFKIHARSDGSSANTKYKICISNIKPPVATDDWTKFTVEVRNWEDTDTSPSVLEKYVDVDLNPESQNYISKVIGDSYMYWDFDRSAGSQGLVETGEFDAVSSRIRVETSYDVKNSLISRTTIPVGFRGAWHLNTSGSGYLATGNALASLSNAKQPPVPFRKTIHAGGLQGSAGTFGESKYYWGIQFDVANSTTRPNDGTTAGQVLRDNTIESLTKWFPNYHTDEANMWLGENEGSATVNGGVVIDSDSFNENIFTLERIQIMTGSNNLIDSTRWDEAVYQRNGVIDNSLTGRFVDVDVDFAKTKNRAYLKYTSIMQGGWDGLNIFDSDKFYMTDAAIRREMDNSNQGQLNGSTVAAYRKAVDILGDRTNVDITLLAIPGIRHPAVTDYALSAVETRFDAMYVMDVEHKDEMNAYITASLSESEYPNVNVQYTTVRFDSRGFDSSFGAAYFPDAIMTDPNDTASSIRVPASTPVLGVYGQNDKLGYIWSAPAGWNRGTLNVEQLGSLLLNENVDTVYDAGINPLVTVPSAGPVVNGQRTLLADATSSLNRVNVRRLLIEIRRQVREVGEKMLFEPSRDSTLKTFAGLVTPIMKKIRSQSGVERYKVQIDTSTTTQTDIENGIIRGKIYLQPTASVEYISLDFEVSNSRNF